jgi:hypothetical protein
VLGQGQLTEDGPYSVYSPTADDPSGGGLYNGWWNLNYDLTDEFPGTHYTHS